MAMDKTNELHTTGAGLLPFDPIVLVRDVLKRWLIIVLAALMVGVGTYIVKDSSYVPVYKTNTVFVVTTRGSSTTVYYNLTSTSNVASLFTELMNCSIMRKTVMEHMGVSSLDASISASVVPNTNLLTMTVSSSNPRTAFLTAQALIDTHETLTYTIVDGILMEVLQYPTVPLRPVNSAGAMSAMKKVAFLTAAVTALALGIFSFMRNAVRSGSEAQKKLDCDYLGHLPHEKKNKTIASMIKRKKTSILIDNPLTGFQYVEAIRKLRRRVEQHMGNRQVLMVTSLLENEGKSTVAVNLALSLAQKHSRVLLIDCDLRKPACHNILDHKQFVCGIKEVLQGKANLSDAVIRHQSTQLYLLLGKKGDQNVGDLITSQRMHILLDWARKNFDYVILDLPPMAAAADAEAMTALADASIMVVRQNEAVAPALNKAMASLDGQHAKLLGCVLNNVHTSRIASGGGYGYGYGYGKYHKYNYYKSYGSGK